MSSKKEKTRGMITRYPGILTDWGGRYISNSVRDCIIVGNIVRIPIESLDGKYLQTSYFRINIIINYYFRIIAKCKKDNYFVGICEDPYYGND